MGRCANRIGGAAFEIDGCRYLVAANNGDHHLHGGIVGFDKQVWQLQELGDDNEKSDYHVSYSTRCLLSVTKEDSGEME